MTEQPTNPTLDPAALPDSPSALFALADAVAAKLNEVPFASMSSDELLDASRVNEQTRARQDAATAALIVELNNQVAYQQAGYQTVLKYMAHGLRLGSREALARMRLMYETAEFLNFGGEMIPPKRPETAQALREGAINRAHVRDIAEIMDKIPASIDSQTVDAAEKQLADAARTLTPEGVRKVGARLLGHLDPDGDLTDDRDRTRTRGFTVAPQDRRLMSRLSGLLTPAVRAKLDVVLTAWAAPGMNNPDDEQSPYGAADRPDLDPEALAAARERDTRTTAQRNHDALAAMLDYVLGHGGMGRPDRLPAELVVTVTDLELAAEAGVAHTATGTDVPVRDLVELVAHATPHLAVFKGHTSEVLYLGRGKRLASKAQRLALFARDRGCTGPECDVPFARTEAHHLVRWENGGLTDIDDLGAACGKHNRAEGSGPGKWETRLVVEGPDAGRVGWRPSGSTGEWQVNPVHHVGQQAHLLPHGPPRGVGSAVEALLSRILDAA